MSAKRRRTANEEPSDTTPRKRSRQLTDFETGDKCDEPDKGYGTPSRSALRKSSLAQELGGRKVNGVPNSTSKPSTPRSTRRVLFSTPARRDGDEERESGTPTTVRNADLSARRKSARRLIERTIAGDQSDDDALDEQEEDELAAEILGREGEIEEESDEELDSDESPQPETPSKRGRGRPKGSKNKQSQRATTPPVDLPSHDLYFWQNRPGASKTSNNTLASHKLLNHEEYFHAMRSYSDRHKAEVGFLHELHTGAFDQWTFELSEGFNICLYGYGSKSKLTESFAAHFHESRVPDDSARPPKILIVNGFNPGITLKDILLSIATGLLHSDAKKNAKLSSQVAPLLSYINASLSYHPPKRPHLLIINSVDAPTIRRTPGPSVLASLAASPHISVLATADTPDFPLLWDMSLLSQYRFIFHDATTFRPYDAEINVVDDVNVLLGRTGRRMQGKDGVNWVLRSLPQNARSLFMILVSEQLAAIEEGFNDDNGPFMDLPSLSEINTPSKAKRTPQKQSQLHRLAPQGVEYRVMYHKAVEAFICTSEVAFRTLLKEFHDHQMVESRKDATGTERLYVPFRREELESLIEELAAEDA